MNAITVTTDDSIQLTIQKIHRNKKFKCANGEYDYECQNCSLKPQLSLSPTKAFLFATVAELNVRNLSTKQWKIPLGSWELVDTDGFSYRAYNYCRILHPPRLMIPGDWNVTPGTQVNFTLLFPELEHGKQVGSLLFISLQQKIYEFKIADLKPEAAELLRIREESAKAEIVNNDPETRIIHSQIDRLESLVHSRIHDVLIPTAAIVVENGIRRMTLELEQRLKFIPEKRRAAFADRIKGILQLYEVKMEEIKTETNHRKILNEKVADLHTLTPRQFEEYIAGVLKEYGFEKVTLTPATNDKGVDILAEYIGVRHAVQCKRYKGIVGSPEIQKFLGAMQHAGAQRGLFITTGTFSVEAEKFAVEHPIELIDSVGLANLVEKALKQPKLSTESVPVQGGLLLS